MKHYQLTIISKNKKSVENCFLFFSNNISENIIKKYFQKKKKKNVLTILKSPHVNKKAQEQFESNFFSKQISIYSSNSSQLLLFFKKVKIYLFPDVKIKVKFILNKNLSEKVKTNIFNPSNFKLNVFKKLKLKKYLQNNKKKIKTKQYEINKQLFLTNTQHLLKVFYMYSKFQKI